MKLAIHKGRGFFFEKWIEYCNLNNINYKIICCYSSNIIADIKDCNAVMWHFLNGDYKDELFAKQFLFSLQACGKKVFPDFNTCWHFDDKVGQKYLLEAIDAPLVSTHIFYEKDDALAWAEQTTYPKVFKLRGGAGSANVKLVKTKHDAVKIINKAFGKGFPQFDRLEYLKEQIRKIKIGKESFIMGMIKGWGRLFISTTYAKIKGPEKGYVYFQDFIPANDSDTRVIVIGDKAFAIKRMVRKNDFRASGSGLIIYQKDVIDTRCIIISFEISEKLKFQCMAYDFVFDSENKPLIIEISYGFSPEGYNDCPGYWDRNLVFHEGSFNPYGWMVEQVSSLSIINKV